VGKSFLPVGLRRFQRRAEEVSLLIREAFLRGISTRQVGRVSLSYSVALQALKPESSPRRRRGLDASTDRGLTERSAEVFSLDILSHRMSALAILRQLRHRSVVRGNRSCRFGSLAAKGTRRIRLRSIGSALETASCASRQRATEMHQLNRVSTLLLFQVS